MIWKISDIFDGIDYRVYLCQSGDGRRELKLAEINSSGPDNAFLRTSTVPRELLLKRNLIAISEKVMLENGERFYVDAHGIWYSESELAQRKGGAKFTDVIWITGAPPKLPPV